MAMYLVRYVILYLLCVCCSAWLVESHLVDSGTFDTEIFRMQHQTSEANVENSVAKEIPKTRSRRDLGAKDERCKNQEQRFLDELKTVKDEFAHVHYFNETKGNMVLIWIGSRVLIAVSEESIGFDGRIDAEPSNLYRSDEYGKVFEDITHLVDNGNTVKIKKNNGLQKNGNQTYLVLHGSNYGETVLMMSSDVCNTFHKSVMPFTFNGALSFHRKDPSYILAYDEAAMELFLSSDSGESWKKIRKNVVTYRWSAWDGDPDYTIYISADPGMIEEYPYVFPSGNTILEKSTNAGQSWKTIHEHILSFGLQGKFLYASVKASVQGERYMEVSTDGGNTWDEVQLPTITEDRFYSILDMSEGQIFMHVDEPGDTGVGTIFTSDGTGIIFSESLDRHLFPNFEDVTDFYKVNSMTGVYIASQLDSDASIHTVITRDRGGEWTRIKRPEGIPCVDEKKECYLQIHYKYSVARGVKAPPPKSVASAVGIIIVHGHVANSLQISDPDMYISSDGGYTWKLALKGPHYNEIADQGGLLVAIEETEYPKTLKFSTDEGNCWHEYQFTDDEFMFTGLLTEPGNNAMSIAIWGYGLDDKKWRVYVIDFEKVIKAKCTDDDYEQWKAHSDNMNDGCLLGKKEFFQRLKPDAWCLNGHARELLSLKTTEICPCTRADYDCDYGYKREPGSDLCVIDDVFKINKFDICKRGTLEEIVYVGYRKIPGDVCSAENGFHPKTDTVVNLKEKCKEGDKSIIAQEEGVDHSQPLESTRKGRAILVLIILSVFAVMLILVVFLVKRYRSIRQSKLVYRYTMLNHDDTESHDVENELATHTSLYEDSSDEESPQTSQLLAKSTLGAQYTSSQPATLTTNGSVVNVSPPPSHPPRTKTEVKSYHDDSDEDLLE